MRCITFSADIAVMIQRQLSQAGDASYMPQGCIIANVDAIHSEAGKPSEVFQGFARHVQQYD